VLKLLTSREHGSIIAAATFGLPESAGGKRNWDYRYTWLRDAAFTTYAFLRLGYTNEAGAFMRWLSARASTGGGSLLRKVAQLCQSPGTLRGRDRQLR
jgi:GH15 family glucan-1,4-alpha-glucosidase